MVLSHMLGVNFHSHLELGSPVPCRLLDPIPTQLLRFRPHRGRERDFR